MKRFFAFILIFLLSACTAQEEKSDIFLTQAPEPQSFTLPPAKVADPVPPKVTQKVFAQNKTYMADQAKKLKEAASTSGVIIKQQETDITIVMPAAIVFGSNQNAIDTQFEPVLAAMARIIKEYDATKIRIIGYTDDTGTVAEKTAFSLRQANTVFNFLRLNGVDINRIVVDGLGPYNPIANNKTLEGRKKNHRVEITLTNVQ